MNRQNRNILQGIERTAMMSDGIYANNKPTMEGLWVNRCGSLFKEQEKLNPTCCLCNLWRSAQSIRIRTRTSIAILITNTKIVTVFSWKKSRNATGARGEAEFVFIIVELSCVDYYFQWFVCAWFGQQRLFLTIWKLVRGLLTVRRSNN